MEERAQSVAHDASVQGVAETLGMAPDEVILRRFPSSEPFGDEERIQGSALSDATWALVPKAESSEGGEDLLILLEFRPSEPWLISLGRGIQRTLSGAELQVVHRRFEMLGSQKHGWLGSRDDGVEGPGANAQQLMPVLLGYVDPRTRALFRNHLLMDSAANPGKP
ncbi:MAG: hypothetical protein ACYTFV_16255 [Planctomycetota bacterium]